MMVPRGVLTVPGRRRSAQFKAHARDDIMMHEAPRHRPMRIPHWQASELRSAAVRLGPDSEIGKDMHRELQVVHRHRMKRVTRDSERKA